jgi:hypothetical protein
MNIDHLDSASPQDIGRFVDDVDDADFDALYDEVRAELVRIGSPPQFLAATDLDHPIPKDEDEAKGPSSLRFPWSEDDKAQYLERMRKRAERSGAADDILRRRDDGADVARWRTLHWLAAHIVSRVGTHEPLFELLHAYWLCRPDVVSLVEYWRDAGQVDTAETVAHFASCNAGDDEAKRATLEELRDSLDQGPYYWEAQLQRLCAAPTMGGWRSLMRFVAPDDLWFRTRRALNVMDRAGVDANMLFRFATELIEMNDARNLLFTGRVSPDTCLERNDTRPHDDGRWYTYAAIAAYEQGDKARALELVLEGNAAATSPDAWVAQELFDFYDDEMTELLVNAGLRNRWDVENLDGSPLTPEAEPLTNNADPKAEPGPMPGAE